MDKRSFLKQALLAPAAATIATHSALSLAETNRNGTDNTRQFRFPNIALKTQDNQVVRFYDDLVKDKVVVFNFFFVSCRDSCPLTTYNITRVQKLLGERVGKDIQFYSISLDPDHDRPDVLKAYAELFKAPAGWTFLTGAREQGNQAELDFFRRQLGFADPDPELDRQRENHIGMLRFGNERRGQWGAMPATMEAKLLAKEILWLVPGAGAEDQRRLNQA